MMSERGYNAVIRSSPFMKEATFPSPRLVQSYRGRALEGWLRRSRFPAVGVYTVYIVLVLQEK